MMMAKADFLRLLDTDSSRSSPRLSKTPQGNIMMTMLAVVSLISLIIVIWSFHYERKVLLMSNTLPSLQTWFSLRLLSRMYIACAYANVTQ